MSYIFKMGEVDYSTSILAPNYQVNETPIYREYTDCNYTVHREIARKKIKGTFTLYFTEKEDFKAFADYLKTNTLLDGSVLVSVYVVNTMEVVDRYVYITWEPKHDIPFYGSKKVDGYEITIEER